MSRVVQAATTVGVFVAGSLCCLAVSVLAGQGWRPAPQLSALAPQTEPPLPPEPKQPVVQTPAEVPPAAGDPGGRPLRAWLLRPSAPSPTARAGVVLIPGAGAASRDSLLAEARVLAEAGLVVLVPDKRTRGYSAWRRDFAALADDAVRASDVLRAAPDVAPSRIGLLGWSEGGWVAPLAASRAPGRIAFVGLVSTPVVSPLEQALWAIRRATPAMPPVLDLVVERTLSSALGSGRWLLPFLAHDSRPALTALRVPVWAAWGADDPIVPVNQAARTVFGAVPGPVSGHIVAGAGHTLPIDSGYLDRAAAWMQHRDPGAPDELRGTEPGSALGVGTPPALAWPSHPLLHIVISSGLVLAWLRRRHFVRLASEGARP